MTLLDIKSHTSMSMKSLISIVALDEDKRDMHLMIEIMFWK